MKFITKDVYVKEISVEEYERLSEVIEDEERLKNRENITQEDKEFVERILEEVRRRMKKDFKDFKPYGLFCGDEYVGYVGLEGYTSDCPEIQIEIQKGFRGKGIGYKAVKYVAEQVFKRENVKCLRYRVLINNVVSLKLIEKLGGKEIEKGDVIEEFIKTFHLYRQ